MLHGLGIIQDCSMFGIGEHSPLRPVLCWPSQLQDMVDRLTALIGPPLQPPTNPPHHYHNGYGASPFLSWYPIATRPYKTTVTPTAPPANRFAQTGHKHPPISISARIGSSSATSRRLLSVLCLPLGLKSSVPYLVHPSSPPACTAEGAHALQSSGE